MNSLGGLLHWMLQALRIRGDASSVNRLPELMESMPRIQGIQLWHGVCRASWYIPSIFGYLALRKKDLGNANLKESSQATC